MTSTSQRELRIDPITGNPVIMSAARGNRPHASTATNRDCRKWAVPPIGAPLVRPLDCPGCIEALTPPAVLVYPEGAPLNSPGWQIRVVPNKFSCFSDAGSSLPFELPAGLCGIQDPAGQCEVLFETPAHDRPLFMFTTEELVLVFRAMISRYEVAKADPKVRLWYAFKNYGERAGGTQPHPHSQLYSLSFLTNAMREQYLRAEQYYNRTGSSLYRDMVSTEAASGDRVVADSLHFLTFCPFASRMQYEICIAPKRHSPEFASMSEEELVDFCVCLRDAVARLCALHPDLAFNIALFTAAFEHLQAPWYSWHVCIFPRLNTLASVELGLGLAVNSVLPETAAACLRQVSAG